MVRKPFVFLLCLVFLIVALTACQTQKPENDHSCSTETETSGSSVPPQGTTEEAPGETDFVETKDEIEAPPETVVIPETPTIQPTPPAPEPPQEPAVPAWKQAYLSLLETMKDYHKPQALVYIDNDDIPELYLNGDCEATGDGIYSYKNGTVVEQRLKRTWGGRYIEKSGEIFNYNGNMGVYITDVYKLTDEGFYQTFSALTTETIEEWVNDEPVLSYGFFVEDVAVSEAEYHQARNAAFDYSQSIRFNENAVTYEVIKEQIEAFGS